MSEFEQENKSEKVSIPISFAEDYLSTLKKIRTQFEQNPTKRTLLTDKLSSLLKEAKFDAQILELEKMIEEHDTEKNHDSGAKGIAMPSEISNLTDSYINAFRVGMASFLQGKISQEIDIVEFDNGVLLDIKQRSFLTNTNQFLGVVDKPEYAIDLLQEKIGDLKRTDLKLLKDTFSEHKFTADTNIIYLGESIIIVKGKKENLWTEKQASSDAEKIKKHLLELHKSVNTTKPAFKIKIPKL